MTREMWHALGRLGLAAGVLLLAVVVGWSTTGWWLP